MYDPNYPGVVSCPPMGPMVPMGPMEYQGHGDGFGDYPEYGMDEIHKEETSSHRTPPPRHRSRKRRDRSHSTSGSDSSKSRANSQSCHRSRSRSRTRSRTRSRSRSNSIKRPSKINICQPSFLDAFRILYLTSNQHKKNTPKFLATKKKQDRIREALDLDGLGSKKWFFYPRKEKNLGRELSEETITPNSCDKRVKIDGVFFRKYKKNKKVDSDSPIAKLKRWELSLYKKFGFIVAV